MNMAVDPIISLAMDNCIASKRWTRPRDWMSVMKDAGITLVEASADTELDPLYMGEAYIKDWILEVQRCSDLTGVKVANLYSGHGTYSTLGLAHTDERVRVRFRDKWMKAQAHTAKQLNAGLGFFAHAIHDPALQDPREYVKILDTLYDDLADLAEYASTIGLSFISVEQMYSPHQPPWTIEGAKKLLESIYSRAKSPFYITLDVGHMNGQQYFLKPSPEQIEQWIEMRRKDRSSKQIWLGPRQAIKLFYDAVEGKVEKGRAIAGIQELWEGYDYLFASPDDGSVCKWLEELAGYSPIIHLQQSDGKSSPHWPFSPEYNVNGIIRGDEVIRSIARAYEKGKQKGLPPLCSEIILTLEPFIGTADNTYNSLKEIEQSVQYWRQFIPTDGVPLSEIVANLK